MSDTHFGVVANREWADRCYKERRDWPLLPVVACSCGQRFYQEFVEQAVCRDCLSVADELARLYVHPVLKEAK